MKPRKTQGALCRSGLALGDEVGRQPMHKTLGDLFMASRGKPVEFQGQKVFPIWSLSINNGALLEVEWIGAKHPGQGLGLSAQGGTMLVNGHKGARFSIWQETAPHRLVVEPQPGKAAMTIKVWNIWRDTFGAEQAWVGNAGMLVEESAVDTLLHCSKGGDKPDFQSLVVRIHIRHAS